MGLYEDCNATRDMYWFGPCEAAYDSVCDSSPTMPVDHGRFPLVPLSADCTANVCNSEQPPLTPSSSISSSSSHHQFVSPGSDRSQYISPSSVEALEPTNLRSPCPVSTTIVPQDLSSSSIHATSSSTVRHATTSITTNSGEISICAGCSDRIVDRFYLLAVERRWHAGCLRCTACRLPLDTAATCFAKDGNIFCKDDYQRLFSIRRCARCGHGVSSAELVMRARDFVYHVQCFSCAQCNIQLTKGDHFGMNGPLIYCRDHYRIPNSMDGGGHVSPCGIPTGPYTPGPPLPSGPPSGQLSIPHLPPEALQGYAPPETVGKLQFFNGVGAPHKGRPRKRKPKDEPMDTNMNLSNSYDLDVYGPLGGSCQPVRNKRVRTSFKHNQLRTMKTYFGVNHNPDAKDLKQLSLKTGLSKRVLQVWFQNARAKWRRQVITKDPKSLGTPGEGGGDTSCQDGSGLEGNGPDCVSEYGASPPSNEPPMSPDEGESSVGSNGTHLPYQHMF